MSRRRYDHPARYLVEETNDRGDRLCSVCQQPIEGSGAAVHHRDEAPVQARPSTPAERPVILEAEQVVARALANQAWTATTTTEDRAKAIVAGLHSAGLLTRRRPARL